MFRLIRMELKRLRYSKAMYFTLLAYLCTYFLGRSGVNELSHKGPATLADAVGCFSSASLLLFLFVPIFISAYIQLDYHSGHIKNIVTATKDKGSFISIKLATIAMISFVTMVVTVIAICIYGAMRGKTGIAVGNIAEDLLIFAEVYCMFLFVNCLYMTFSVLFRKELFAILLDLLIGIGLPMTVSVVPNEILNKIATYMVLNNVTSADDVTSLGMRFLMLGMSVVYIILLTWLMKTVVRKRDIQV